MSSTHQASVWKDSPLRFGLVSRILHWGMAFLFMWQFGGMLSKVTLGRDAELTKMLSSAHADIGVLLLVLIVIRGLWGLINMKQRPKHGKGLIGIAAWLGHLALYALMFVVPFLAFLRMLGNTRAYSWFGVIPFNAGGGERVEWMIAPASAAHGLLAWVLLFTIIGHIGMVFVHKFIWNDEIPQRMIGRIKSQ